MGQWWRRFGAAVATGVVMSTVMTWVGDMTWGWDFAARCLLISAAYAVMGPLVARSRRNAEEQDRHHMRAVQEARRDRR